METVVPIVCPFCGQSFELVIDASVASQQFVTDCEVCCRPFQVFAECNDDGGVTVDVAAE